MAYHIDGATGDLIVDGFQNGVGDSPHSGLTDMKSVNPVSVPGEASISFSTQTVSAGPSPSTVISAAPNGTGNQMTATGFNPNVLLEVGHAVLITGSIVTGIVSGTVYFIKTIAKVSSTSEFLTFSATPGGVEQSIGATGTATFTTLWPALPKYFAKSVGNNFMVDSLGLVWGDIITTSGATGIPATGSWTYMGNSGNIGSSADSSANGNGLLVYKTVHNGTGGASTTGHQGVPATYDSWLFVWRNGQIDYTQIISNDSLVAVSWVYGWNPTVGTPNHTGYLATPAGRNNPHQAISTLPNIAVYCDSFYVAIFSQNIPALAYNNYIGFNPLDPTTYYFNNFAILPPNETAQCLTFLNQYVLIGSDSNFIYPWDAEGLALKYTAPAILLPEKNVSAMVTAGNNAYVFAGNRGIIYVTNGSQASFFKKIPDHLSGTVEPLFWWGGSLGTPQNTPTGTAICQKNRLYFGFCATSPATGATVTGYGGIWCIDLSTGAMWQSNQLSYGTYAGLASAFLIPTAGASYGPSVGYGIVAGWWDGQNSYGVDVSISNPYSNGQSWVVSDIIPVGTFFKPMTAQQLEFKVSSPLLTGESVQLLMGSSLNDVYGSGSMTAVGTTSGDATGTVFSGNFPITVQSQQWLIVKAILTYASGTPSYNRLTQIRIIGDTIATKVANEPYSTQ